jgi:HAE1 family hydrophobic/amphiphilic exporter-1
LNPIQFSVRNPYTVAVAVLLLALFSVLAMLRIPIQLKPTVDTPVITVTTSYRGASAADVEEQVTRELEEVLQSVQGVIEMSSESAEGISTITLEFPFGTNLQLAAIDVTNQLSRVQRMPIEADEPAISLANADRENASMWIAIRTHYDDDYARRLVEDNVRARLERSRGVSSLLVVGGSEREVQVRVDPDLLVGYGVQVAEVLAALERGNVNVRGGSIETETRQLSVRTVGRPLDPRELAELVVKETAGGSVRLNQVATVVDGYRESNGFVSIDGTPGVAIGVRRMAGFNVVELIEGVEAVLAQLNETFQNRGLDLRLEPVYRETTYIEDALDFVQGNMLVGAALATVVLLLFLRSLRSVLIVAISIPISLVAVFLVMLAAGRSINVISLAGLAFASGMVVDNAIVVLENVFRHLERGKGAIQASIDGGREVWGGVLASTLTTAAVFLPILLQEEEASQIFLDIALAIAAAVVLSLAVALTVVPVLTALFYRGARPGPVADEQRLALGALGRAYARFTAWLGRRDGATVAGKAGFAALVLALCLSSYAIVPSAEYLPTGNQNLIFYFAAPIPGTRPEAVHENFKPFVDFIRAQPETESSFAVTMPDFNGGGAVLKREHSDGASLESFHQRLFGPAFTTPGFLYLVPIRASLFEEAGKQFEVELSGPDYEVLGQAAQELQGALQGVEGVQFVRSSLITGKPELRVVVDEQRAKDLGLDVGAVGAVVETFVAGRRASQLIDGGREVDVNLVAPQVRLASLGDLSSVRFIAPDGRAVALSSVARVERGGGPLSIRHLERERNVLLTVNIAPGAPLERVVEQVENVVFPPLGAKLGPSYALRVGGAGDKLKTTLSSLTGGFGLSTLIVYLLLVALFASWSAPFVILLTIPLSVAGGLLGIRVASELSGGMAAFDVISMLGFTILAGIVVNNGILIVHQANNFVKDGEAPMDALANACTTRLRPILMTVITTVAGMLPLAIGRGSGAELYQGLAAVIVGGLVVSTLITLFLVPMVLSLVWQWKEPVLVREEEARGEAA